VATAAEEFWAHSGARVCVVDCEHRELLGFEATYLQLLDCLEGKKSRYWTTSTAGRRR